MKPHIAILAITFAIVTAASALDVSDLLSEAQRAYIRGDAATAKEKFGLVLKLDPENRTANIYTRRIAAEEEKENALHGPPNATKATLDKLMMPQVEFKDASVAEALEFLRKKGNQLGEGKVSINFVLKLDEKVEDIKVTLSLQNVPFTEVLRYIGELAGLEFTYERYAITVKVKSAAGAEPKAAAPESSGIKVNGL